MGVDYDGVGGVGFKPDDVDIQILIASGLFTKEEFEGDAIGCLDKLHLRTSMAGSCYSGELVTYILVKGKTLKEINDNAPAFCARLAEFGIIKTPDELEIISDLYIS